MSHLLLTNNIDQYDTEAILQFKPLSSHGLF